MGRDRARAAKPSGNKANARGKNPQRNKTARRSYKSDRAKSTQNSYRSARSNPTGYTAAPDKPVQNSYRVARSVPVQILQLRLEKPVHGGDCLARHEGKVYFVRYGIPGELVRAQVVKEQSKIAFAQVVEVLESASSRRVGKINAPGAELEHLNYPAQLEWKTQVLADTLGRIGGKAVLESLGEVPPVLSTQAVLGEVPLVLSAQAVLGEVPLVLSAQTVSGEQGVLDERGVSGEQTVLSEPTVLGEPTVGEKDASGNGEEKSLKLSGEPDQYWRIRADFEVDSQGRLAMHAYRSNELVPLDNLDFTHPIIAKAGLLKEQCWQSIFTPGARVRVWASSLGLRVWVNGRVYDEKAKALLGDRIPLEVVGLGRFQIQADGFWQAHYLAGEVLGKLVCKLLGETVGEVMELYAGAGLLSVALTQVPGISRVWSYEGSPEAVKCGQANLRKYQNVSLQQLDITGASVEKLLRFAGGRSAGGVGNVGGIGSAGSGRENLSDNGGSSVGGSENSSGSSGGSESKNPSSGSNGMDTLPTDTFPSTELGSGNREVGHADTYPSELSGGQTGGLKIPSAKPAAVVLDPPRSGAGREVMEALARQEVEQVLYIACDIAALSRDLKVAVENGYRIEYLQAIDLFPGTAHVETVCLMTRVR